MTNLSIEIAAIQPKLLTVADLKRHVGDYLSQERLEVIERAYEFAVEAHQGQLRKSGEPYVQHPLQAACLVADLRMDASTIVATLLHDTVEDCGVSLEELQKRFGPEVAVLVDGVTKLSKIALSETALQDQHRPANAVSPEENLRKMLLAMAEDIRVVIIKLADRLHNMRTLQALPADRRRAIARETLEIYAPLATRLGIWQFKWELEDLSFRYLDPTQHKEISQMLTTSRATQEAYIEQVSGLLQAELDKAAVKGEVAGRAKHIFSIAQKRQKYATQGKNPAEIYDVLALRVLVENLQDCYGVLGVVHSLWHPLPGTFDDYISMPKESGYQSLHTTVMAPGGHALEVQIRTREMHYVSEYGVAAHWRYKEGTGSDLHVEEKLTWLRQLLEWQREVQGAEEFVESVKTDFFNDRVFVFTPKGEIKDLPAESTPIDFAYSVHTELGHRCVGAKVNGRLVPLDYTLKTGDVVDIMTGKGDRGPRLDWLNPNLGYIKSAAARARIRQWFRRQARPENIERGQELVRRELTRLGVTLSDLEVAKLFKFSKVDDFFAAVGYGDVNPGAISIKLAAQQERPIPMSTLPAPMPSTTTQSIRVRGVGDLLTRLASCCHPVPGDAITGYVTRARGVTVHRADCPNILNEDEKERLISVEWGAASQLFSVPVRITAIDRVGLLRDIASTVSSEKINILRTYQAAQQDGTAQFLLTLETTGMSQLSRVMAKIDSLAGVTSVVRVLDGNVPD